jgi:hypothetical protein
MAYIGVCFGLCVLFSPSAFSAKRRSFVSFFFLFVFVVVVVVVVVADVALDR